MGLTCLECGTRFYLPPGEQPFLEKRCSGSITTPSVPQYCVECMERRFACAVSKQNQTRSRDGSMRMPSGEKEFVASYAEDQVEFVGERLKTPLAQLGTDCAGIQFQRLKPGRTFFGRLSEELPKGETIVHIDRKESATLLQDGDLTGVMITIEFQSRKCLSFNSSSHTVTIDTPFANKFMSATSYYIFQSFGTATFPDPLCPNDSITKLRMRRARKRMALIFKTQKDAQETRNFQKESIVTDKWGPPCKVNHLADDWNVEMLSAPQRRLQGNCLNFVNALVMSSQAGALIDHTTSIMQARMLAVCMGMHHRCGQYSMFYNVLHGQHKLFRKIVALAVKAPRLPRWLRDSRVSETMSENMHMPIAVCAAVFTAEKAKEREQKRREKFFEDRERLFSLASKTATGTSPDLTLPVNAPSKASFVPSASGKSAMAGTKSLCATSTRALQGFKNESSIAESKQKMKDASESFRRAPDARAHDVNGLQTPLSCTESSQTNSHYHTPSASSRAQSVSSQSPRETLSCQNTATAAALSDHTTQVISAT